MPAQFAREQRKQLRAQRFCGAVGGRCAGLARVPQAHQDRREQRFLARKVVVNRALGDARACGDAVHAGGVVTGAEKFLDGRFQNGGAFAVGQALRGSGRIHDAILLVRLVAGRPRRCVFALGAGHFDAICADVRSFCDI
jgi:hypothetical protein